MTRLSQLIAKMEGFGKLGAIPTIRMNPGNLRHSPHCSHVGIGANDIGLMDSVEHGWEDLERQLRLYAERGLTIQQAISAFAPPVENDTRNYLEFVCTGLGMPPDTLMEAALTVEPA